MSWALMTLAAEGRAGRAFIVEVQVRTVKAGVPPPSLYSRCSPNLDCLLHLVQLTQILSMFQSSTQEYFVQVASLLVYLRQWSRAKPQPVPAGVGSP